MPRTLPITLLLASLALSPLRASAQDAPDGLGRVLLELVQADGAPSRSRAEHLLTRAIEARGVEVVREPSYAQAGNAHGCVSGHCLVERLRAAHADVLFAVGAWLERPRPELALTLDDGVSTVSVSVDGEASGSEAELATRLVDVAFRRYRTRRGVPLRVEGTPAGASLMLDGQPMGHIPSVLPVQPGSHDVRVAHVDYATAHRTLDVGDEGAELRIALQPEAGAGSDEGAHSTTSTQELHPAPPTRRTRPLVGPLLLGVAGAAAVSWGAWSISRSGCVEHDAAGVCTGMRRFSAGQNAGHALALVGGGLALVGAVLWFSLGGQDAEDATVQLGLGGRGARLQVTF